jgi:hypothetical protein
MKPMFNVYTPDGGIITFDGTEAHYRIGDQNAVLEVWTGRADNKSTYGPAGWLLVDDYTVKEPPEGPTAEELEQIVKEIREERGMHE